MALENENDLYILVDKKELSQMASKNDFDDEEYAKIVFKTFSQYSSSHMKSRLAIRNTSF